MNAIGIDIGTTSICGVSINIENGELLGQYTIPGDAFIPTENSWEKIQDVSKIIASAEEILENLLDEDTMVIGLTGQMHGILYTDEYGNAVSPLYTWQDGRGNLPYQDTTYAAYLGSHTGYGNVTDYYNRVNGIRPREAVSYCTIQDYLGMKLCRLTAPVIHISNAASFGGDGADTVENKAKVTDDYCIIGSYKGIPVSIAIGDNQASVFSTLADEGGLLINVGTGSQITIISDKRIEGENIESRPYVENKYLVVGAALCGGRAYALLKDFFKEVLQAAGADTADVYSIMETLMDRDKIAEHGDDKEKIKVDTRFAGTRQNPEIRGSITDIGEKSFTPGKLTKGVLEGMAEELSRMYAEMKVVRTGLVGSGNGIRKNSKLIEVLEKCFGEKMRIPAHKEEAAYGAALFGLVACGRFKNAAEAQKLIRYEDETYN